MKKHYMYNYQSKEKKSYGDTFMLFLKTFYAVYKLWLAVSVLCGMQICLKPDLVIRVGAIYFE